MRQVNVLRFFFVLFLFIPMICMCGERTIVLDRSQITEANVNGLVVSNAGDYAVWVWSLDSKHVAVELDGKVLYHPADPKAGIGVYSWKRLGVYTVDKPKTISLQLLSTDITKSLKPTALGWLALSLDSDWSPKEWFELSRVHPNRAQISDDARLGVLRSKDHFYPFPRYNSKREWLERKQYIKEHFLTSMGCNPMPPKTPLNPKTTGKIEHNDYTIENVYFESLPGFFVTGNLYRPKGKQGPLPAILCPHGHWSEGILTNTDVNSIPGRCINFAKQGYVVFAIDMIGYNNSQQLAHNFGGPSEWLWGLSLHGLQFWNSVRAIDYLESLEDVDKERIAVTGASGGGTQTYGLIAGDDRIVAAAPVNMLSSHFQGGCLCENCANLRIALNNVELGAMMAPKPLMMVSCTGDWTAETLRIEYPAIRSVYELYDRPEQLGVVQIDAGHNYNQLSREAVYAFFGKWILKDNNADKFHETDFTVDPAEKMKVFPNGLPENALDERGIVTEWKAMSEDQLNSIFPDDNRSLSALRRRAEPALRHVLGVSNPNPNDLIVERISAEKKGDLFVEKIVLGRKEIGDKIPAILLIPNNYTTEGSLLIHCQGKDAWFDSGTGKPCDFVQKILKRGQSVVLADVFLTGEFHSPFQKAKRDTDINHFLTYNQSDAALRIQDIVTLIAFMQSRYEMQKVNLVGDRDAGLWCLLAASMSKRLNSVAIDANGWSDKDDDLITDRLYVPGLRRAGDIRTAQALLAPTPLLIHNTASVFDTAWAYAAYRTAGASDLFETIEAPASAEQLADWIGDIE